jgi:GDP-6-deoxy-D-talose 4-dehydrogenase
MWPGGIGLLSQMPISVQKDNTKRTKRCLIVGSNSFIGTNLCCESGSDDGLQFTAIDGRSMDLRVASQVGNVIAAHQPNIIVNLAGISSPASDDLLGLYQVNALGHLNILQAAAALQHKPKVILASSAQLYGPGIFVSTSEQSPLNPVSHYGLSKLLAEKYCELFAEGVPTVIARIYNTIGRGQSPLFLIAKIVQAFKERRPTLELGSLDVERDFVDVRDLSTMFKIVMLSEAPPAIVNFSNGETAGVRDIIDRLSAMTGHHIDIISNSARMRRNDISFQRGDNAMIRKMGYVRRYSLDETLLWMLNG